MSEAVREADSWNSTMFNNDASLLQEIQGCVRMLNALTRRKLRFLDRIPYLACRLGEDGVARRCLEQYDQPTPNGHHELSHHFFRPGGLLRELVDSLPAGHCELPEELLRSKGGCRGFSAWCLH
jgi:hypothetical protein